MLQIFSDLRVSLVNFRRMNLEKWRISRTGIASIRTHHTTTANMKTQMRMTGLWKMTTTMTESKWWVGKNVFKHWKGVCVSSLSVLR